MAVYTAIEKAQLESFIEPFGIGPLVGFEGVAAGIDNTTYFITTDQSDFPSELRTEPLQHFVLTLFEQATIEELTFYTKLTSLLSLRGLPVPCPINDADGQALHYIQGKPALIVPKVAGQHPEHPTEKQCQEIGHVLGQIHNTCLDAKLDHPSPKGLRWLEQCASKLRPLLDKQEQQLLDEIPRFMQLTTQHPNLTQAIIHGDLFRDNALFKNDHLTGVIDFYCAGTGFLVLDLAITANDWCSATDGSMNNELSTTLLEAYQSVRPLTDDEKLLWNDFLRIAATRFWLSRLSSQLLPNPHHHADALIAPKNPLHYKNILLQRIHNHQSL